MRLGLDRATAAGTSLANLKLTGGAYHGKGDAEQAILNAIFAGPDSADCQHLRWVVDSTNNVRFQGSTLPSAYQYWKAAYQHIYNMDDVQIAGTVFNTHN